MRVTEREITAEVEVCRPDGTLNPDAVGWTRHPLHDTSRIGRGRRGWGRAKRWEYWAVTTPTHLVGVTVSSLDYAGVYAVWVHDRRSGETVSHDVIDPLGRGASLPARLGDDPARASAGGLTIAIEAASGGTRLSVDGPRVRLDVLAERPAGHEAMGVVVPWSARRFQYTVKDIARPALGSLWVDGVEHPVAAGDSWAVLDHGRGRWPYAVHWNWGAGSGLVDGRVIGVQVGGRWTDGTGSTENALVVDGRVHKISEELSWSYDTRDWLAPWRVRGDLADLTFTPFWNHSSATNLGVLAQRANQCFGHWSGWMRDDAGERVSVDGVLGWAEDVHNRW
ncbi:DUF2804 domain-containing protein [Ornithinibacter sp.]|uniref:DUF2804 domain-containing protein n=1 Tax=Ornithinibacter sp. TaxID=2862748 RepID=UPI002C61BB9B|nr:DUF2804 domain-containing protein [Ornithinibacter sp.]HRA25232.1 DUF2804 domain-containing protein [Ornithinibacter sp.]